MFEITFNAFDLGKSKLYELEKLFTSRWHDLCIITTNTKIYKEGLVLAEGTITWLERKEFPVSEVQYNNMLMNAILYKLLCLDKLDMWGQYIYWFDYYLESNLTTDQVTYIIQQPRENEEYYGKFFISKDGNFITFSRLWYQQSRYEVIARKFKRGLSGKSRRSDFHKQKAEYSKEVLESYYKNTMSLISKLFAERHGLDFRNHN